MADDNKIIVDLLVEGVDKFKADLKGGQDAVEKFTTEAKQGTTEAKQGFDQLGKSTESFKSQLKTMTSELIAANIQLAEMQDAGQQGTKEFTALEKKISDLTKKAGNLKDAIGDANQVISQAGSDTAGLDKAIRAVGTATAAFQVFEGAAVLAGKGNEDLQKALVKLNAVMAVTQGLQQIQNELTRNDSVFKGMAAKATAAYNLVVGQSTGLLKAFRVALAATGIGLIVIALGALIANWDKFTNAIRNSFPALDSVIKFFENIKQISAGAIAGLVEGFKVVGEVVVNLFKGQFSQAINVAKDFGKRTATAYNQGYKTEDEKIKIQQSIEQRKLNARLLEAQGKDTLAIRLKIAEDELKLFEKNSKEYNDKLVEVEELRYKIREKGLEDYRRIQKDIEILNGRSSKMTPTTIPIQLPQNYDAITVLGLPSKEELENNKKETEKKITETLDSAAEIIKSRTAQLQNEYGVTLQKTTEEVMLTNAKKALNTFETINSIIGQTNQVISNATAIRAENEIRALEKKRDRGLITEKQYEREVAKIKNEQARKKKIADTINAFAMIPMAVLNALTSIPFPANIAAAAVVGALATAQAAIIAAAPLPKFKQGGSVAKRLGLMRGKSHEQGGIPIEVEGNEYVMNQKAVRKYGVDFMDSINNLKLSPAVTMQAKLDNLNKTDYKLYEHLSTLGSYMKQDYRANETGNNYLRQLIEVSKTNKTYV